MNQKYIVNDDYIFSVITETGEIIEKTRYTKNTDEILSLENYEEKTEEKKKFFENRLTELTNKIRNKNNINRKINIALMILVFILSIISLTITTKLFLILIISSIPLATIVGIIEKELIKKDEEKRNHFNEKVNEENCRLNKINKKIEILSKDKTPKTDVQTNTFIEVKTIEKYELDIVDYFISKYQLDKRVAELSHTKHKAKKLTRKNNNNMYQI